MKLIVVFGETMLRASAIVSGLYATYAVCFEAVDAYRYRQDRRATQLG